MNELSIGNYIGAGGMTYDQFSADLRTAGRAPLVRVCSPGGDVFQGLGIANLVRSSGATVLVEGLAASIASVIAIAGSPVQMAQDAWLMVHAPWNVSIGGADDMRDCAALLDKLTGTLANIYARRTGKTDAEVRAWLAKDTWFDAEQAKAANLVDEVVEASGDGAFASARLDQFANLPPALAQIVARSQSTPPTKPEDLRAQVQQLQSQLAAEKTKRIRAALITAASELRIAANDIDKVWLPAVLKDENMLAVVQAMPAVPLGCEPVDIEPYTQGGSGADIYSRHLAALKRRRG